MMMTGNGFPAMGSVLIEKTSVLFAPFKGETRASFRMMVMRKHDDQQKRAGRRKKEGSESDAVSLTAKIGLFAAKKQNRAKKQRFFAVF